MTTRVHFQDTQFQSLLCRHFRISGADFLLPATTPLLTHQPSALHQRIINETNFVLQLRKGVLGLNCGSVIFVSHAGDIYPVSMDERGVAAALMSSSAFLFAEDRLTDRDLFMLDVAETFPDVLDWACHMPEAAKQLKKRYGIDFLT